MSDPVQYRNGKRQKRSSGNPNPTGVTTGIVAGAGALATAGAGAYYYQNNKNNQQPFLPPSGPDRRTREWDEMYQNDMGSSDAPIGGSSIKPRDYDYLEQSDGHNPFHLIDDNENDILDQEIRRPNTPANPFAAYNKQRGWIMGDEIAAENKARHERAVALDHEYGDPLDETNYAKPNLFTGGDDLKQQALENEGVNAQISDKKQITDANMQNSVLDEENAATWKSGGNPFNKGNWQAQALDEHNATMANSADNFAKANRYETTYNETTRANLRSRMSAIDEDWKNVPTSQPTDMQKSYQYNPPSENPQSGLAIQRQRGGTPAEATNGGDYGVSDFPASQSAAERSWDSNYSGNYYNSAKRSFGYGSPEYANANYGGYEGSSNYWQHTPGRFGTNGGYNASSFPNPNGMAPEDIKGSVEYNEARGKMYGSAARSRSAAVADAGAGAGEEGMVTKVVTSGGRAEAAGGLLEGAGAADVLADAAVLAI